MNPAELLTELEGRGVKVSVAGEKLRLEAPAGALTPQLKQAVVERKRELMALVIRRDAEKAARLLKERGWCAVACRTLGGEVVLWVKNAGIAIPAKWQNAVRYTLAELATLTKPPVPGPEELRKLHEAKRMFAGEIGAGEPEEDGFFPDYRSGDKQ